MTRQRAGAFSLTRRNFLALSAAGTSAVVLAACGNGSSAATVVGPDSDVVGQAEDARRSAVGRQVDISLRAQSSTIDLGGVQVQTWTFGDRLPGAEVRLSRGDVLRAQLDNRLEQETTIHWHGIALRNDMDGVPGLTQPAVASGDSFGYDFTVPDAGTYFFHPHVGTQLDRGLYAPLIVEDPADGSDYDLEAVLVLDDWLDGVAGDPDRELERLRSEGMSMGGMSMSAPTAQSPLGGDTGDVSYPYYLINGKIAADPIVLGGRPGQRLRLRIINAAADTAFRFAVGGHPLTVTHSDGFPVQPEQAQCLLIGMGERYDAIITLQDGAFPIVAAAEGKDGSGFAVLRTGPGAAPQSSVRPAELSAAPVMADQLMSLDTVRLSAREPDRTYDIALGMEMGGYTWTLNGETYEQHTPLDVREGERVRLRFVNATMMFHPMHLHGHTFEVVNGAGSGPRKDTSLVLPNQTVEVDFDTDNPGQWLLHCHNLYHGEAGMMTSVSYLA